MAANAKNTLPILTILADDFFNLSKIFGGNEILIASKSSSVFVDVLILSSSLIFLY